MPFGVVSAVGRGMGVLDGDSLRRRDQMGSFGGKFGASHCNQWELRCTVGPERCAFPKLLACGLKQLGSSSNILTIVLTVLIVFMCMRPVANFHCMSKCILSFCK